MTIRPACLTLKLIHRDQMLLENNKREACIVNKHNRALHRDNNDNGKNSDSSNNDTSKGIFCLREPQ